MGPASNAACSLRALRTALLQAAKHPDLTNIADQLTAAATHIPNEPKTSQKASKKPAASQLERTLQSAAAALTQHLCIAPPTSLQLACDLATSCLSCWRALLASTPARGQRMDHHRACTTTVSSSRSWQPKLTHQLLITASKYLTA